MEHSHSSSRTVSIGRVRIDSGLVALAVGMLGSGAAQTAWNWPLGGVHIVAGLFATALVPVSLHLWPRVPVTGTATRVIRGVVMTYICLAAASVNLMHATWLLTDRNPQPTTVVIESRVATLADGPPSAANTVLAILLITAIEAVMVMASLARRAPSSRVQISAPVSTPAAPPAVTAEPEPVPPPAVVAEPEPLNTAVVEPAQPMSYDEAVAWAAREDAGAKLIMKHCGLSEYKAKQAARDAKAARALRIAR